MSQTSCPACATGSLKSFYECRQTPIHTTLLMPTRQVALDYPRRNIELAFCDYCGFVTNRLFERGLHEYSSSCEEGQDFSPTFTRWLNGIAQQLIADFDIRNQTILEIGCGKGEFLAMLCDMGGNTGIGYDPAFVEGRLDTSSERIEFQTTLWDSSLGVDHADVIVCRHTLEHIPDVYDFLNSIRVAVGGKTETLLFFEVPDTLRVLKEGAFWDVYYEHCSYFSPDSLRALFSASGFEVLECWMDYDEQYILLTAKPSTMAPEFKRPQGSQPTEQLIEQFKTRYAAGRAKWTTILDDCAHEGKSVALWGGGSKAAAFLNQVDRGSFIRYVIDINPNKHHYFIPGSGLEVVGPETLKEEPVEVIILMNPVYLEEVQRYLDVHHLAVYLVTL